MVLILPIYAESLIDRISDFYFVDYSLKSVYYIVIHKLIKLAYNFMERPLKIHYERILSWKNELLLTCKVLSGTAVKR